MNVNHLAQCRAKIKSINWSYRKITATIIRLPKPPHPRRRRRQNASHLASNMNLTSPRKKVSDLGLRFSGYIFSRVQYIKMVDIFSPTERSARMALIKSKDTTPEVRLRRALHSQGLRYRLHVKGLPGRPDIVFPRFRTILFVHGCFWHQHKNCRLASTPKTNTNYWKHKLSENVSRDARTSKALSELGWAVIVVWECEISSRKKANVLAQEIASQLRANLRSNPSKV